jgi:hypothetical protein
MVIFFRFIFLYHQINVPFLPDNNRVYRVFHLRVSDRDDVSGGIKIHIVLKVYLGPSIDRIQINLKFRSQENGFLHIDRIIRIGFYRLSRAGDLGKQIIAAGT